MTDPADVPAGAAELIPGDPLPAIGRAARVRCADSGGDGDIRGELWRLPGPGDPDGDAGARIARRLLHLGAAGVGGFRAGGVPASRSSAGSESDTASAPGASGQASGKPGPWLWRAPAGPTLRAWLREHPGPVPWRQAVRMAASLCRAAAACEAGALFPGPIAPATATVRDPDGALELRAEPLVRALVGAPADAASAGGGTGRRGHGAPSRWAPPEQAAGAPWDNAANRYAIGLILYRLLAGEHPFAGRGLRLGLDDQAQRGAPPLPDAVASQLPPGLHSLCLRAIAPDPRERPASAAALADELEAYLFGSRSPSTARASAATPAATGRARAASGGAPARRAASAPTSRAPAAGPPARASMSATRTLLAWGAPLAGAAAAALVLAAVRPAPAGKPRVEPRAALADARMVASDCAGCHPRQTAEWHRSVMAHAAKSPLFQALEMLIQEQVGRDLACPGGAGVLRHADPRTACRDRATGLPVTGSGGALWCVNCHAAGYNLSAGAGATAPGATAGELPPWDGTAALSASRRPLRDLLGADAMEGISCAFCHQVEGPAHPGDAAAGRYEGNPLWTSTRTGQRFSMRPEDLRGLFGIANSGYSPAPDVLLPRPGDAAADLVPTGVHRRLRPDVRAYLRSSEFCGACHDVRLFGADVLGSLRGERFKRLRNAYSEWADWAAGERAAGRAPATCQDCHMSTFPGVCAPAGDHTAAAGADDSGGADDGGGAARRTLADTACPPGTRFEPRDPGAYPTGRASAASRAGPVTTHYFSGVDVPLAPAFDPRLVDDPTLDAAGLPLGGRQRRDLLLARALRLDVIEPRTFGDRLEIPVEIENIGAGHRIPAGFSQEREFWVHLRVTDARGAVVYEVGRVDRPDEDLRDRVFLRVGTSDRATDRQGRPLGLFGADVIDGPDAPRWDPPPDHGGTAFRGRGLINFQNGFLRCVRCIGRIDAGGRCQPLPGQEAHRAARYADGDYDIDTGECRSNLRGLEALFEVYFPVGALDASRGVVKGPDAIVDTRSAAPGVPVRYTYELPMSGATGPFTVEARLLFRAFPPFLLRAFVDYEAAQAARGLRPSGPLITAGALDRLDVVELAYVRTVAR